MHAEALLLPFIMDVEDPIWLCMKLHLRIIRAMSQHAITRDAVDDLAKTIYKWQKLFLSISEYDDLFKPKAHFYSHYPMDILNFGPTRQYWCMRFEAFTLPWARRNTAKKWWKVRFIKGMRHEPRKTREWLVAWDGEDEHGNGWYDSWEPTKNVSKDMIEDYFSNAKERRHRTIEIDTRPLDYIVQKSISTAALQQAKDSFGHKTVTPLPELALADIAYHYLQAQREAFPAAEERLHSSSALPACLHHLPASNCLPPASHSMSTDSFRTRGRT